jgi:hypothetical protein
VSRLPGPFESLRRDLISQFIRSEAVELEATWASIGWTPGVCRRAERCANTLISVFGQGSYRIVHIVRGRNGHAGP